MVAKTGLMLLLGAALCAGATLDRPSRIVHGEQVAAGAAPWQVSIQSSRGSHFCGGTLVRNDYVVTAAHCAIPYSKNQIRVKLGVNHLSDSGPTFRVKEMVHNKLFNNEDLLGDIALLKLDIGSVSHAGRPISMELDEMRMESTCTVTGFGKTREKAAHISDSLLKAKVTMWTEADCQNTFPLPNFKITSGHVCAGGQDTDACQGDSGGPLVCCMDETLDPASCKLVGVVSWGIGCATRDLPGVYTKVAHFQDWINQNIATIERSIATRSSHGKHHNKD